MYSVPRVLSFVPVLVCYLSFTAMAYNTLRMFQSCSTVRHMNTWRRLLAIFEEGEAARSDGLVDYTKVSFGRVPCH